jgi:hypothetical protein
MEDQLDARLGPELHQLWNTVYLDAALTQLRADGYPVLAGDVARLSPYMRRHINVYLDRRMSPAIDALLARARS